MRNWKVWVGIAISALCVWWAFRDVPGGPFLRALAVTNYWIAAPMSVAILGIVYLRAIRWRFLVGHLKPIPVFSLWLSALVGFGVNNLLPARIGELARCYTLRRAEGVRFSSILATVVVERMWDGLSVVALLLIAYTFWAFPGVDLALGVSHRAVLTTMAASTAVLLGGFLLLRYASDPLLRLADRFLARLPDGFARKAGGTLRTFVSGFQGIRGPAQWLGVIAFSLLPWGLSVVVMWVLAYACGADLSVEQTVVLFMAIVAAVTIPASPGYIGTYHVLAKKALVWAGYAPDQALAVATMIHLANYVPQTLGGLWALKRQGLDMTAVKSIQEPDVAEGGS